MNGTKFVLSCSNHARRLLPEPSCALPLWTSGLAQTQPMGQAAPVTQQHDVHVRHLLPSALHASPMSTSGLLVIQVTGKPAVGHHLTCSSMITSNDACTADLPVA